MIKPNRVLGIFSITMINIVAVDSLRSLPFSAEFGSSVVLFYLLCALMFFFPTALVAAELATGWPSKGGVYIWVREAFGELPGFVVIWLQWVYNIVWYPTILSFVAGALAYLINPHLADSKVYMLSVVMIVFWGATLINFYGMKASSAVSTFGALFGTLIPMFFIIILGAIWLLMGKTMQIHFNWVSVRPEFNIKDIAFLTAVLFGLVGMEMSAIHADEVKNPGKTYPRAILISSIVILASLILSSLSIAMAVPLQQLNVVTGLVQAFMIFFNAYHMRWMEPVITLFIIIGGICGVATWIIGPTKGLLVAVRDGSAPAFFGRTNSRDVPVIILIIQAIIFTLLCSVFLLAPTVSGSYWILTAMTAQLAMLGYIAMFIAAIKLRYKSPDVVRNYKIPFGNIGMWIVAGFGIIASVAAIIFGFFPPSVINVGGILKYELILIIGIVALCFPPVIIYKFKLCR